MIGNRIAKRMHELGLSGGELARRSGVPQPTIHRILSGTSVSPRQENVERIAKVLGVTTEWLWKGESGNPVPVAPHTNVEPGPHVRGFVPLISWVQAGAWCEMQEPLEMHEAEAWLPCAVSHSSSTFALRVRGLSMFNPHERRSFREGDIIFVDPAKEYENGSLVIAKLADSREATFKQLVIEGDRQFLKPLNPSWPDPIIELPPDAAICGVVVSKVEIF
ncbi:SOS-response transcriptional repressor LexA [Pseudomonas sp. TE6288]|uniref:LexA family protein n=1 Tax=Pseudomonas TaxID=286 RepID=UPI000D9E0294|nr:MULTISPECIES: S24 family peptidase [Pseudomonas]MCU9528663.1 helix-turn-helix domain-containing protein [Pseudomonas mosselii]MCU9535064.1 helix-turn-helix domain-containing protein [Pseudomonas mosselii]MCU9541461.1 helix-turn-helix domain-containing protein [Pseudomonas mosselii]MCU9546799.1 helix-turn-helix domain-containing protein [Pseudomonas mosselii]PYC45533.1 peptidase S24 [Pseudomonas soli]